MVNHDTPSAVPHLWPWQEQPHKLWSLWDMLTVSVFDLLSGLRSLDLANTGLVISRADPSNLAKQMEEAGAAVKNIKRVLGILPFSPSLLLQADRALDLIETSALQDTSKADTVIAVVNELSLNLQVELSPWVFFYVSPERADYYSQPEKFFGQDVFDAFRKSEPDLRAAGRCFAFRESTACVFHLMRAVEVGLHKWVKRLGIVLPRPIAECTEKTILDQAAKKIEQLVPKLQKTAAGARRLQALRESLATFGAIKDAWRNQVAHGKRTYEEGETEDLMRHVRAFMRTLTIRPQ